MQVLSSSALPTDVNPPSYSLLFRLFDAAPPLTLARCECLNFAKRGGAYRHLRAAIAFLHIQHEHAPQQYPYAPVLPVSPAAAPRFKVRYLVVLISLRSTNTSITISERASSTTSQQPGNIGPVESRRRVLPQHVLVAMAEAESDDDEDTSSESDSDAEDEEEEEGERQWFVLLTLLVVSRSELTIPCASVIASTSSRCIHRPQAVSNTRLQISRRHC